GVRAGWGGGPQYRQPPQRRYWSTDFFPFRECHLRRGRRYHALLLGLPARRHHPDPAEHLMLYIEYSEGRMVVRCKGECKEIIVFKGCPTSHYAELVLEMQEPSGMLSKHETGVCTQCKARILFHGPSIGELDAIYAQDVEQWKATAEHAGTSPADVLRMAAMFAGRIPLRALDEKGRGERV